MSNNDKTAKKKFFPDNAKAAAAPTGAVEPKIAAKRTPWARKPAEFGHGTPAGPCISLKKKFDTIVAEKYKKLTETQRRQLWDSFTAQVLIEPAVSLERFIDSNHNKI